MLVLIPVPDKRNMEKIFWAIPKLNAGLAKNIKARNENYNITINKQNFTLLFCHSLIQHVLIILLISFQNR